MKNKSEWLLRGLGWSFCIGERIPPRPCRRGARRVCRTTTAMTL